MLKYTNRTNLPLSLAVFLANDSYKIEDKAISVTSLIKPLKPLILAQRVPESTRKVDLSDVISSRLGTAYHDAIKNAWVNNKDTAMKALGYPQHIIDRVKVNPDPSTLQPNDIPVYTEIRTSREYRGYRISGEFDFVADGRVEDHKSTTTFTYQNNTKDEDYILQGSMYRWLNPKLITKDSVAINFIFTDWSARYLRQDPTYPPQKILQKVYPLKTVPATEQFINGKLNLIETYMDAPETDIPECTDTDLWRSDPVYKYYKNKSKMDKSTKNFDTYAEAHSRYLADGAVGIIVEKRGEVKACKYCPGFEACTQKDRYILSGELTI